MTNPAQPAGYLARPPSGDGPPVLALHAWWGLNQTVKSFCDRLAEEGYLVFAPDLYDGHVTDEIAVADELSGAIFHNLEAARIVADRAPAYLLRLAAPGAQGADTGTRPVAAIGFSLGAFFALDLSIRHPQAVKAVVAYYGTHPGDFTGATAAYLGHFAELDDFEPPSEVDALEQALRSAGRPVTFHTYPDTRHWFAESDRDGAFVPQAAALAWQRTLDFLKEQLR